MSVLEYTADGSRLDVLLSQDGALSRSNIAQPQPLGNFQIASGHTVKQCGKPAPLRGGALAGIEQIGQLFILRIAPAGGGYHDAAAMGIGG